MSEIIIKELNDKYSQTKPFPFHKVLIESMEYAENIHTDSHEKKVIASHILSEVILLRNDIDEQEKKNLVSVISPTIEAVIISSKNKKLNKITHSQLEYSDIVKNTFENIIDFIKSKKFTIFNIMENIFIITLRTMFLVGAYPALTGKMKKEIVIDIITRIMKNFKDTFNGETIPSTFIATISDKLPHIIDVLVDISEGKFNINQIKKCCAFFCC